MNVRLCDKIVLDRVCLGNTEAIDFLANHWALYVHEIDDIIDGDRTTAEEILSTFARAIILYSHPFYLRHLPALRQLALTITNTYADSVAWETRGEGWRRDWADHNRHVGMEMVIAVAQLCGGYEHGRLVSQELREICFAEHPSVSNKIKETYDSNNGTEHHRTVGSSIVQEQPTRRNGD